MLWNERIARLLHDWYLEAVEKLDPEHFNRNAQKPYDELSEQQKSIDLHIAARTIEYFKDVYLGPKTVPTIVADFGAAERKDGEGGT